MLHHKAAELNSRSSSFLHDVGEVEAYCNLSTSEETYFIGADTFTFMLFTKYTLPSTLTKQEGQHN